MSQSIPTQGHEVPSSQVEAPVSQGSDRDSAIGWSLLANPIFMMGVRTRLRPRQAAAWGLMAFLLAAFVFSIVYLSAYNRGVSSAIAAKGSIVPLFVLQGLILMLFGTGAVASGIAIDRDSGTMNFQRMTPMSPASKIFGYLFGLPVRQYMMFLMTTPFLIAAVIMSGISVLKVLHFYMVFFTTVWLYHMIGMVSGMITPRPRRVGWLAMVTIVLLYWIMPQLSRLGFTFFGFVTVIPTFEVLLTGELTSHIAAAKRLSDAGMLNSWSDLQFFTMHVHPTIYTLVIQGVLLLTCFTVVYRKWHREDNHALPKAYALGLFTWVQFFLVGSLWPFLAQEKKLVGVLKQLGNISPTAYSNVILYALFFLSGAIGVWLLYIISPSWFTYTKGLRRARKRKSEGVPLWSDAASSFWYAISFVVLTCLSYTVLLSLMIIQKHVFLSTPPLHKCLALPVIFGGFMLAMFGLRERFETKGFLFGLFLLWALPFFVGSILMAAFRLYIAGAYAMTIIPMASFFFALQYLNTDVFTRLFTGNYGLHVPTLTWLSAALQWVVAFVALWWWRDKRLEVRKAEAQESADRAASEM